MKLPLHRWFRYAAGFSAEWVQQVLQNTCNGVPIRLLDPFAGSGTTVLAGQAVGIEAIGLEAHPFVARIAQAKLLWGTDVAAFQALAHEIGAQAKTFRGQACCLSKTDQRMLSTSNLSRT